MKRFIIMAISLFLFIVLLSMKYKGDKIIANNPKLIYGDNDFNISLNYSEKEKGIYCSFYNNLDSNQLIPNIFIELFMKGIDDNYSIINDEIKITTENGEYFDCLITYIDYDIENVSIEDCYNIQPKSVYNTKIIPIKKIIDVNSLESGSILFKYEGHLGKSNTLKISKTMLNL